MTGSTDARRDRRYALIGMRQFAGAVLLLLGGAGAIFYPIRVAHAVIDARFPLGSLSGSILSVFALVAAVRLLRRRPHDVAAFVGD